MKYPTRLFVLLLALASCSTPTQEATGNAPTPQPEPTPAPQPDPVNDTTPDFMIGTWISTQDYEVHDGIAYNEEGGIVFMAPVVPDSMTSRILVTMVVLNADGTGFLESIRQTTDWHVMGNQPDHDLDERNYLINGLFPMWAEKTTNDFTWTYIDGVLAINEFRTGGAGVLAQGVDPDSYQESDIEIGINISSGTPVYGTSGGVGQLDSFHAQMVRSLVVGDWHNTTIVGDMPGLEVHHINGVFSVTGNTATSELFSFFTRANMTFVKK